MESHSAPPGYNPNVSLLQGGTAPITPVQGGGGMGQPPTPDYNASISLLEGGTGTIQAVKGGGPGDKVKFAPGEALKKVKVFQKEEEKQENKRGVIDFYSIEKYSIADSSEKLPTLATSKKARRDIYNRVDSNEGIASIYKLTDGAPRYIPVKRGSYDLCKKPRSLTFLSTIERRVRVSDVTDPFIMLAVNIKGDLKKFLKVKELFIKENTPERKNNVFLFFMGSFFSQSVSESNQVLYDEFMRLKQAYGRDRQQKFFCQVYGLFEVNDSFLNNACDITESLYETKQSASGKVLPTFHEPDIFVFPKRKLVLRTCPLPVAKDKMSLHTYLKSEIREKPALFLLEQGTEEHAPQFKYFDISFDTTKRQTTFPAESQIKCKDAVCPGFQEGFPLKTFIGGNYKSHLNLVESGLYLIYNNDNMYKLPYLREDVENREEPPKVNEEEEVEILEEENNIVPPSPGPPATPKKPSPQLERIEEAEKEKDAFDASAQAYKSETSTDFQIQYEEFSIRNPTKDNQVKEDWLKGIFTEGEVALLNGLKLSPKLLAELFKDKSYEELASFLESLTNSSCFKNTQYLLTSECDQARRFLRKVYFKVYVNALNKLYAQWEMSAPPPDSKELLEALLKEIGTFMMMVGKNTKAIQTNTGTGTGTGANTELKRLENFVAPANDEKLRKFYENTNNTNIDEKLGFVEFGEEGKDKIPKNKFLKPIDVPKNGWCFYYALKRQLGPAPNFDVLTNEQIEVSGNPTVKETVPFIQAIQEWIREKQETKLLTSLAELFNTDPDHEPSRQRKLYTDYKSYIDKLDQEDPKIWADPQYGIGLALTNILDAKIHIVKLFDPDDPENYKDIMTFVPYGYFKKTFTLLYINNNHYQILLEKKDTSKDSSGKQKPKNKLERLENFKPTTTAENNERLRTLLANENVTNANVLNNTDTPIAQSETTPLIKKNNKNTKKKGLLSRIQEKIKKGTRKLRFPKRGYADITNNNTSNSVPGLKNTTKKNNEMRRKAEAKVEAQRLANLKVLAKRQAKNENTRRKKEAKVEAQRLANLKVLAKRQAKEQNQSKKKVKQNTKYKTLKNKNKQVAPNPFNNDELWNKAQRDR